MPVSKHFCLLISVKKFLINGYKKDLRINKHFFEGKRKVILRVGELVWASYFVGDLTVIPLISTMVLFLYEGCLQLAWCYNHLKQDMMQSFTNRSVCISITTRAIILILIMLSV